MEDVAVLITVVPLGMGLLLYIVLKKRKIDRKYD